LVLPLGIDLFEKRGKGRTDSQLHLTQTQTRYLTNGRRVEKVEKLKPDEEENDSNTLTTTGKPFTAFH
jgi:hypothetical protein